MEKPSSGLMEELSLGHDLAQQLQQLLLHHHSSSSPPDTRNSLLQSILSCYDRALSSPLLHNAPSVKPFDLASSLKRKRKDEGDRMEMVRGLENEEDGYSWRKYGQKWILGSKYPRGYFRCTHRPVQGCLATKLVQRSDDEPCLFQVTYRGRHTCIPPISSKLDHQGPIMTPSCIQDVKEQPTFPPFSFLETPGEENGNTKGTYSDALAEEQGTLLDDFDFDLDQWLQEQTSESGLASAPTSVTNSPAVFPLQELGFDQEFPFDDLEFLSGNETRQKGGKQ